MGEPDGGSFFCLLCRMVSGFPCLQEGVGVGLYRLGMARLFYFSFWFFFFLVAECDAEASLDTLAFGMRFFELLSRTFEVSPHVLQLGGYLLL